MKEITEDDLRDLIQSESDSAGCVSIYMPTSRKHPENQQDPIRFKNLAKSVLEQIGQADFFSREEASVVTAKLSELEANRDFWNHRTDGLAWFYQNGEPKFFEFQRSVPEVAIVAHSLHIKPLIRIVQTAERFHVLAITRHSARLFAGTRDALDEILIPEVPGTIQEALGEELTDQHLAVASYGGTDQAMHHGHGSKDDETNKDRDRYFRVVATAIEKHWSNPTRLPLVLVALDEHHAHYRRVSSDRYLLDQGVAKDPSAMSIDEIRAATWNVVRGYFDQQMTSDIERLEEATAKHKGTTVVSDLVREARNGRIELLFLEDDARLPGRVNWETGEINECGLDDPNVDDVLDDVAEMVLVNRGKVRIVRAGSLKTPTKIAGIFRY